MTLKFRTLRHSLLIGASVTSIMVAGVAHAQSAGVFRGRGGTANPADAAARAAQGQATRAAQTNSASQRAIQAFRRAADTRSAMSAAQVAARAAAKAAQSNVPNGLGAGGLQVANGVVFGPDGKPIEGALWIGANGPVQSMADGRYLVVIDQTTQKAILTWDSFNIGRETDLTFKQGGTDWVVLNRVTDASLDPSKILGTIKAAGSVYLLNRNGVIFGGASQVNVRSLIASTANLSNDQFLNRGIYSQLSGANYLPTFTNAGGVVKVEAGAQIVTNTPASVTSGGGFVLLMGTEVINEGTILTPRGQAALVAGDDFILRRGYGTEENKYSTTRGNEVRGLIDAGSTSGTVTNSGLIEASEGDVTLAGRTIRQDGVLVATTSVNQRGTIHLLNSASDTQGSVTFGKDSLTAILPELDSKDTALNGQRDALIAESDKANAARGLTTTGGFDDRSLLADRLDQSRVEIVTGGGVLFEGGSQTMAQGGQVAVQANAGRITVADGARIDVSGVMGVALDMESNSMRVNIQGNELRDSPANREGTGLKSQNVWVDVRDLVLLPSGTGGYEGDRWYTPGGLLEVGGYLANRAHGIGEWAAVGGTITLAAKEVVAHQGATFDISGGSLDYAAGYIASTRLLGADGRMYDIRNAPANMKFVAVGNAFMRKHDRWGEQFAEVYSNPLFSRGHSMRWEEGYSVGRDAGKLVLSAPTVVMEATILNDVLNGTHQTNVRADGIIDGYKVGQHTRAQAGTLAVGRFTAQGNVNGFDTAITIGDVAEITGGLTPTDALPGDRINTVQLDAGYLNAQKLGGLELTTRGAIRIESDLTLADGGEVTLTAPVIDVSATVTARGGRFDASNILNRNPPAPLLSLESFLIGGKSSFTLADSGVIDLRGLWLNAGGSDALPVGLGLIDGGTVDINYAGDVTIAAGSRIDVSSGGAILALGEMRGGRGGNVSLAANSERIAENQGRLTLDGAIAGYGVTGGGTLVLNTGGKVAIGATEAADDTLNLSADRFASGFSAYTINGQAGLRVAEGATIDVVMPVYRFMDGATSAPTGTDPASALELWTPPVYQEDPQAAQLIQRGGASLTLKAQRDFRGSTLEIGKGATVSVDPGQRIDIISSSQMTLDGRLNAWGGTVRFEAPRVDGGASAPEHYRSIWIGETGVIDVAGRAFSAVDAQGRRYGVVQDGGKIELGGGLDWEDPKAINGLIPDLHLVIRPGAVLDASGASAVFDLPGLDKGSAVRPVTVASDGGLIALKWGNSLYLDGTIRAAAGGTGASGGTLAVAGGGGLYRLGTTGPVMNTRNLLLTQKQGASLLGPDIAVGDTLTYGSARLSAEQIEAGGFDHLALGAALLVNDDFSLTMRQSFRSVNQFAVAAAAADGRRIDISAPYIKLGSQGTAREVIATLLIGTPSLGQIATRNDIAHFEADHIDLAGRVAYLGYADLSLTAKGDIRLLKVNEDVNQKNTTLVSSDRITLTAAQVYAATNAQGIIAVGKDTGAAFAAPDDPDDAIIIRSHGGPAPAMPYSAGSTLQLRAQIIEQGGVLRAPLGSIVLGEINDKPTVRFLPGSVTSVSGAGLVMPYGGTIDGVKYNYDGEEAPPAIIGGVSNGFYGRNLTIAGADIIVEKGAVLDMSGGGDLRGIGFISGRGGSVDVLQTPFANANPAFGFSSADNQVYALVPGFTGYAPIAGERGAGTPQMGRQVTIPAGVPGLPAGTYTLMPSNYALLPGAFRVEIGAQSPKLTGVMPTGNGSFVLAGQLGVANTGVHSAIARQILVTPADVVRTHSSYNETSYNAFILADAARRNVPRTMLTVDARALVLNLSLDAGMPGGTGGLSFAGTALFDAAPKSEGFGGILSVNGNSGVLQILADGQAPLEGIAGAAVYASQLNAFQPNRLMINATLGAINPQTVELLIQPRGQTILRSGATLRAPEVIFGAAEGNIGLLIEQGATIDTVGQGKPGFDSSQGYVFSTSIGAMVVSNGWMNLMPSTGAVKPTIDIGGCAVGSTCTGETRLLTEGTIAVATNGNFLLRDTVSYGARDLVLAVSAVNMGSNEALANAGASGHLPPGMTLNQALLTKLLDGNTATGTPALQSLVLNARESFNIFGSVELDTRNADGTYRLERLVFGAPAIYGYGSASDVTTIRTGEFIWAGTGPAFPLANLRPGDALNVAPGSAMLDQLGGGTLNVEAKTIRFGYAPNSTPLGLVPTDRIALGFGTLNLNATQSISADANNGSLYVYRDRAGYTAGKGWSYTGGDLNITTPLLTGGSSGKLAVVAGGAIDIKGGTSAALPATDKLGAELRFVGQTIRLDTAVVLPSGKLVLDAAGDVTLGDDARIDMAGREITLFDVKRYSWGGDVLLTSRAGDIAMAAGASIDLSAQYNRGGSLEVTALGEDAGHVALLGTIKGKATGIYDAGGSLVPYDAGQLTLRAQTLEGFADLNTRLNAGELFGARRFQLKQGDLVVGDEVKAREVQIVLDGGDLTVNGRIDASGHQVGAIRLAAMGDLTINGTLDAHAKGIRLDSYGKPIDSANRATVELTTRDGTLTMGAGAVVDLRVGTDLTKPDTVARGTLDLIAPRVGTNDIAMNIGGAIDVRGAKTVAVYGMRSYDDAPLATLPDVTGSRPQLITQAYLDRIDLDSTAYMNAALANPALAGRLGGLAGYRLRPGVEITSNATTNPAGNLTVSGDIDLAGYRYGPNANRADPSLRGFGEPGMLVLRAAGDVNIHGSINDGFGTPPANPDEKGWLLTEARNANGNGFTPFAADIVVPIDGVKLETGTIFPENVTLNYDINVRAVTLPSGTTIPAQVTLTGAMTLPAGLVLSADVTTASGTVYKAGTVLGEALVLGSGAKLAAGFLLRSDAPVAAFTWPAGVKMPVALTTNGRTTLARGSLIPSNTKVELLNDQPINLRPVGPDGKQGVNWALAPMLPEGTTSWDLTVVAGADMGSSDVRARNELSTGDIVLADTHYGKVGRIDIRFEGGSPGSGGGGGLVLTQQGAELLYSGDTSWTGLNEEEQEERLLKEYGYSFMDYWGGSLADVCSWYAGVCETIAPKPFVFTPDGAMTWLGDAKYARLTAAELDAAMMVDFGVGFMDFYGVTLDDFCIQNAGNCMRQGVEPIPPTEVREIKMYDASPLFSVLRTGGGDLSLVAGRDITMMSLYGVYTAGEQTSIAGIDNERFNQKQGFQVDTVLAEGGNPYEAALAAARAWYPDHGGNLLVSAGRNIIGDSLGGIRASFGTSGSSEERNESRASSVDIGNWLWRQGTGNIAGVDKIDTSWWINFGGYANLLDSTGNSIRTARLVGFTGFGALGGGNVSIQAAGDAGLVNGRGDGRSPSFFNGNRSEGLVVAVGSTGRVVGNELVLTGGGDLDIRIGGALNPNAIMSQQERSGPNGQGTQDHLDLNGVFTNLRGTLSFNAGAMGGITPIYGLDGEGVRPNDPFAAGGALPIAGPVLVLGDATAWLNTRDDMVVSAVINPGLVDVAHSGIYANNGVRYDNRGQTDFSLWTAATAVNLFSAGGDVVPVALGEGNDIGTNVQVKSGYYYYPSILRAVAPGGDIRIPGWQGTPATTQQVMMAPSPTGQLELLAGGSIRAGNNGIGFGISGASLDVVPTPFNPAFSLMRWSGGSIDLTNMAIAGVPGMFAFGQNTVKTALHADDPNPARIYAVNGDIIGLRLGGVVPGKNANAQPGQIGTADAFWYEMAMPVQMRAGRDILSVTVGAVNNRVSDITLLQAGRDIVHADVTIAGPGNLELIAGGQIRQEDAASVRSIGSLIPGDTRPGASIALQAGMTGVNWQAVRDRYLNPANLLVPNPDGQIPPLEGSGKVAKVYDKELGVWLKDRFGFTGTHDENLAYFDGLAPEQQRVFLRQVYYAETREGGREYNEPESTRFNSYLRGREMIGTLFPDKDAAGTDITRTGDILFYSALYEVFDPSNGLPTGQFTRKDSGVQTLFGGDIEMMAPGGQIVAGVQGVLPGASAGFSTQGAGDIRLFSQNSLLLGLSRIMTTFGGDIFAWSEEGDINAGRGAKTTILYTPARRIYDNYGIVRLSPQVPSSGAGIATLAPIPEVPAGDVDLIAPLGTIDAGEAGIRVSGNINLAALQVLNAANIQVKGTAKGIPQAVVVNTGALTAASSATSAIVAEATRLAERSRPAIRTDVPNIIVARFIGFGEQP